MSNDTEIRINPMSVYPSILELVPERMRHGIPHSLVEILTERYAAHGGKYMLNKWHSDKDGYSSRQVNAVVECDNLQSLIEEIDDAIFNWFAWAFVKYGRVNEQDIDPDMMVAMDHLIRAYVIVAREQTDKREQQEPEA